MIRTVGNDGVLNQDWVEAAPFRAHLRHLMAVGNLSSAGVAVLAGVSPNMTGRLLHGRTGRPVRRLHPDTARKLLRVTPAEARAVRRRTVPADTTREHLDRLAASGWDSVDLAMTLGVSAAELADLQAGRQATCTQLVALRAAAEVALLMSRLPLAASRARAAA